MTSGTLTASSGGGVTVSGSGTATLTLSGTLANLNTYFAGASQPAYAPAADFNGTVTLTLTTNDGGNTGTAGALTDVDTSTITVVAVADIVNDTALTNENTPVTISVLSNDTFSDPGRTITAVDGVAITAGGAGVSVTGGAVTLNMSGQLIFSRWRATTARRRHLHGGGGRGNGNRYGKRDGWCGERRASEYTAVWVDDRGRHAGDVVRTFRC